MPVVWAYVSLWLCGFVCSDVCCRGQWGWRYHEFSVGPMRFWHLTWHCLKKSNKGTLRMPSWSSQFFRLLLRLEVFRSTTSKYPHDSNAECSDAAFYLGSITVGAASRHFWPNSAITNGTTHVFHNLWALFHLPQGETGVWKIIYFSKFFHLHWQTGRGLGKRQSGMLNFAQESLLPFAQISTNRFHLPKNGREKYTWNWYQHESSFGTFRPGKQD